MDKLQLLVETTAKKGETPFTSELQNDLLKEFHRGRPLDDLRPLLTSDSASLVKAGVWIASELGAAARPLLPAITSLLRHPAKAVRFFAIDSVLTTAITPGDAEAIASVATLLEDEAGAVRRKAMDFLWRALESQLKLATQALESRSRNSPHVAGLRLLLRAESAASAELVREIEHSESLRRKYGVIAAAHSARPDEGPLIDALGAEDDDVRHFANDVIELRRLSQRR